MSGTHEYLEIGGKFVANPFRKEDELHGVHLNRLLVKLHDSGATELRDFEAILMTAIEVEIGLEDEEKAEDVFQYIMVKLGDLGVISNQRSH